MPQSLANILIHIVFSTKNREDLIVPFIETELYRYMASIYQKKSCPALVIGGTTNHIHTLCRLERAITIAYLLQHVKKCTSKWIKVKYPDSADFAWQSGYGVFSIGASNIEQVTQYIRTQKQHHQDISFETEYKTLLQRYSIDYDERYMWD